MIMVLVGLVALVISMSIKRFQAGEPIPRPSDGAVDAADAGAAIDDPSLPRDLPRGVRLRVEIFLINDRTEFEYVFVTQKDSVPRFMGADLVAYALRHFPACLHPHREGLRLMTDKEINRYRQTPKDERIYLRGPST
jgi:hypothetical protein